MANSPQGQNIAARISALRAMWDWWFKPRSQHPAIAFRERSVRLLLFVFALLVGVTIVRENIAGTIRTGPLWYAIDLISFVLFTLLAGVFVVRQNIDAASIFTYLLLLRTTFFWGLNNGLDETSLPFAVLFGTVFAALILPARLIILSGIGFAIAAVFGAWVSGQLGVYAFDPDLVVQASVLTAFVMIGIGIPLAYIRGQLDFHIQELVLFVSQLETRVAERTAEVEARTAELQRANRTKSFYLATMSHEIRTPLNAIINFTDFVRAGLYGTANEKQVEALGKVSGSARHLLALINDVLDISKIESGGAKLTMVDDVGLADVLTAISETATGLVADKAVVVRLDVPGRLPRVPGDVTRVRQIMLNLVSNACKFTLVGEVRIAASVAEGEVIVSVSDTGPGIVLEEQAVIFEPFRQTRDGAKAGGTGLGLPIARTLVEAHGGRLWLESTVGVGSTFFVALPVAA